MPGKRFAAGLGMMAGALDTAVTSRTWPASLAGPTVMPDKLTVCSGASSLICSGLGWFSVGTSLTASFLEALGIDMGRDLVPADEHNRRGYFEDTDFLEISPTRELAALYAHVAGG